MNELLYIVKKHILNFPGRKLNRKYVVIESDDWGSERIPSKETIRSLLSLGISVYNNPFNYLDSLENEDDLSALFDVLLKFKDYHGNHPVFTANSVTSNPDFGKIKASGYNEYHFEDIIQTYRNKDNCKNSWKIIHEGIDKGIYHPQFHGREHLNVHQWLRALQTGDRKVIDAFDAGVYGVDFDSRLTRRTNFMAAFDFNTDQEAIYQPNLISEGTTLFKRLFGYTSESFIAPCYVWQPEIEKFLLANGIRYIQGLPIQYVPGYGSKYKKIYHYMGEQNDLKQFYFVRNCFFEPSLYPEINYIKDCLKRLEVIFYWGKPAIIGTHRINFMGTLNENNRKQNLQGLSTMLQLILDTWPDVEFITTDKLGEIYSNN